MKATATSLAKIAKNNFVATALLVATLQGVNASEGSGISTQPAADWRMSQFLGGIVLPQADTSSASTTALQFVRDIDGYGLASRIASTEEKEAAGVDPIKTAAIIPGVFGSVAIPMRNFPVAGRWAKVYSEIDVCLDASACGEKGTAFAALTEDARNKKFLDKLATVNRTVNTLIAYRKDEATYGNLDYWANPAEILSSGAGDCEDFAILKMAALIEAGVPAQSMSLVVLQDRSRGVFHAVLSVATQSGTFILDNLTNKVLRDGALKSYVPLYSFSTDRAWIHGARPGSNQMVAATGNFAAIAPGEGPLPQ